MDPNRPSRGQQTLVRPQCPGLGSEVPVEPCAGEEVQDKGAWEAPGVTLPGALSSQDRHWLTIPFLSPHKLHPTLDCPDLLRNVEDNSLFMSEDRYQVTRKPH